jgi:hypothetical protein
MTEPMQLSIGQQFELERMNRVIDQAQDIQELRDICKKLLQAWQSQRAATAWVMSRNLSPMTIPTPEDSS